MDFEGRYIRNFTEEKTSKISEIAFAIFVSPELSSVRDYVITHSVHSMCMYVYVCGILQN